MDDDADVNVTHVLSRALKEKEKDHPLTWNRLGEREQASLKATGWNQYSWDHGDYVLPGVKDIGGTIEDPLLWFSIIFSGIMNYGPTVVAGITEYLCLDGDCGNELDIAYHARLRMAQRGVSLEQLEEVLKGIPFRYFHDGLWKLGYYDAANRIMVAVNEVDKIIITVITNVKPEYIERLKKMVTP